MTASADPTALDTAGITSLDEPVAGDAPDLASGGDPGGQRRPHAVVIRVADSGREVLAGIQTRPSPGIAQQLGRAIEGRALFVQHVLS